MDWLALLIIILILGSLAGGDSFGETVRKGCGCLIWLLIGILILAVIAGSPDGREDGQQPLDGPAPPPPADGGGLEVHHGGGRGWRDRAAQTG